MALFRDLYHQVRSFPQTVKLFYVSDIFFAFAQAIFATLFNLHLLAVGYSPDHIGTLQSTGAIIAAVTAIPIGVLADRFGRRWLYVAGSVLFGIPFLVMPLLTDFRLLLGAFGIYTLGNTLMFVNEAPLLAGEVRPEERAPVFSFMMVNFFLWQTLGIQLAGYLTHWLPAGALSIYVWPLAVAGVMGILSGAIRLFLPFRAHRPTGTGLRLLPSRTALSLGLVSVLAGAFSALSLNFDNVVLAERFSFGSEAVATVMTVAAVLGWIGSLAVPTLSRRMGDLRGYVLTIGLQGIALAYMGIAGVPAAYLPGFWFRSVMASMQITLFNAFSMAVTAEAERATANSYAMVGRNVGAAVASKGFGLALAGGQYLQAFLTAGALALATALITRRAFPGHRRETDLEP